LLRYRSLKENTEIQRNAETIGIRESVDARGTHTEGLEDFSVAR